MKIKLFLISFLIGVASISSVEIKAIVIVEEGILEKDYSDAVGVVSDVVPTEIVEPFLGQKVSQTTIKKLEETVRVFLKDEGQFGTAVFFPRQDVSQGVIVLQIAYATIQTVCISGNRWGSDSFYEEQLHLASGEPLKTPELLNQVAWFNRNPFRYAEVVIAPVGANGANVELLVKDRFSLRPFVGADNTGTNLTDEARLFAGVNWGKAFGRPDLLTYQYTAAPNPREFYSHTASYLVFLPWKHELTFFGGFSAVHPHIPHFRHEGISVQASARYGIPLGELYETTQQIVTCGYDYKNINSNVFFIDSSPAVPVVAQQANISQFYLGYSWQKCDLLIKVEGFYSPGRWLPNQTDERYDRLRPDSSAHYFYARAAAGDIYGNFETLSFSWLARGQVASGPLLPSEQFGLGGYDTVRGYKERDFLVDNFLCANFELRAPRFINLTSSKDELIILAFTDIAGGSNYKSELSSQKSQFLWSAGLGARYRVAPYLTFRADCGFPLHHIFGQDSLARFHLGGYVSY